MKGIGFILAITVFTSCAKHEIPDPSPQQGGNVTVSFISQANSLESKAFFDPTSTTEAWEKAIGSMTVLVFEGGGHLVCQHDFTQAEITARKATFTLPQSVVQTACSFFAIANRPITNVRSKSELLGLLEESCGTYNGPFEEVTSKAMRPEGFVMSGTSSQTIASGSTTEVSIDLERTVAKIAIRATLSSDFPKKYQGSIRITTAEISGAASQSPLLRQLLSASEEMGYTAEQATSISVEGFDNLFYLFESDSDSPVMLTLRGIYDQDGNEETTDDRFPVSYRVALGGPKEEREIVRNGYYRISITISGLSGDDINFGIEVKEWVVPGSDIIELG